MEEATKILKEKGISTDLMSVYLQKASMALADAKIAAENDKPLAACSCVGEADVYLDAAREVWAELTNKK